MNGSVRIWAKFVIISLKLSVLKGDLILRDCFQRVKTNRLKPLIEPNYTLLTAFFGLGPLPATYLFPFSTIPTIAACEAFPRQCPANAFIMKRGRT
jgi:hypothetical protein